MIRQQVRKELARVVAADPALGNVAVTAAYPGDKRVKVEAIFGDRTDGEVSFPYAMAPPAIMRDDFTVVFVVRVASARTAEECADRCEELATLVARRIAETGQDLDGFTANGEQVCEVGPVAYATRDGEAATSAAGTQPIAMAELTLTVQTQSINEE